MKLSNLQDENATNVYTPLKNKIECKLINNEILQFEYTLYLQIVIYYQSLRDDKLMIVDV